MKRSILGAVLASGLAAGLLASAETPWPGGDWPTASPSEQGLDASRLDELVRLIEEGEAAIRIGRSSSSTRTSCRRRK